MLRRSLRTLSMILGLSVLAQGDPVIGKLNQVADLQLPELMKVMGLYQDLYVELRKLRVRPSGCTPQSS